MKASKPMPMLVALRRGGDVGSAANVPHLTLAESSDTN